MRVISDKNGLLQEENSDLQDCVINLEESAKLPFQSNEKALIISEQVESEIEDIDEVLEENNEFINEDMMAFMPFKK